MYTIMEFLPIGNGVIFTGFKTIDRGDSILLMHFDKYYCMILMKGY